MHCQNLKENHTEELLFRACEYVDMNTYYFDSNSLGHSVYCTEVAHRIKRPVPNDVGLIYRPLHPNKTLQETLEKLQNGALKKSSECPGF